MELPFEISPREVRGLLDSGRKIQLVDVREPEEHRTAQIEGARLIPMRTVPLNLQELEGEDSTLVVFCHHGVRSLSVVDWLRRQGIENCQSMAGGIDRWSSEVDGSIPRY